MHVGRKAQKREKKAMSVSLYGNLFFVIVEIVMAIYTSSQAVLLDAIYDGVEFCMLLPSLFLIPLLYKPSNEKHPFGYMQIESMFVVVKGITMTGVTLGLILNNIEIMIHGGRKVAFDTIAWFELFAFFLGITVSIYLKYKNRLMDSPMITMEMEGWKIDSIASFGMAIAFFLPVLFRLAILLNYFHLLSLESVLYFHHHLSVCLDHPKPFLPVPPVLLTLLTVFQKNLP